MSRNIDWGKPLSAEDYAWASQYSQFTDQIKANREQFPVDDDADETDADDAPDYDDTNKWKVRDLQMEIERRNKEYGTTMATDGKRQELVERLREDDRQADEAAKAV